MSIAVVIDEAVFNEAVKYTFQTLLGDFLGLDFKIYTQAQIAESPKNLTIFYGFEKNKKEKYNIEIFSSNIWLKDHYLKKHSLPAKALKYQEPKLKPVINEEELIVLFLGETTHSQYPFIESKTNCIATNIDIIATVFFMLSRYEEIVSLKTDAFSRFPAIESLGYKEHFLKRPIVNEYVELLWSWLEKFAPQIQRKKREFKLLITHDVDNIRHCNFLERVRSIFRQLYRQKSLRRFFKVFWLNFRWIFEKRKEVFNYLIYYSKKYGLKPHFYFIMNGKSKFDKRYNPKSKKVIKILQKLKSEGFEIGLHPSFSSFLDFEQLCYEKELLEEILDSKITKVRNHYLRIRVPDSLRLFEKANFLQDSSLGFSQHFGYRAGVCYPYQVFDLTMNKPLKIIEYPLILMDTTFLHFPEVDTPEKVFQIYQNQIDKIKFFKGTAVILIHKSSLEHFEFPWRIVYQKILEHYLQEQS